MDNFSHGSQNDNYENSDSYNNLNNSEVSSTLGYHIDSFDFKSWSLHFIPRK